MSGVWTFFAVGVHKYCQMQSLDACGKEVLLCLGPDSDRQHLSNIPELE